MTGSFVRAAPGPLPPPQQRRSQRRLDHAVVRDDYGGGGGRDVVPERDEGQDARRGAEGGHKGRKKAVAFTGTEDQMMATIEEERSRPNVMPHLLLLKMKLLFLLNPSSSVTPLFAPFIDVCWCYSLLPLDVVAAAWIVLG